MNLQATDITKSYSVGIWPRRRQLRVLNGASVELDRGEVVGLVGENGSRDEVYDLPSFRSLGAARRCRSVSPVGNRPLEVLSARLGIVIGASPRLIDSSASRTTLCSGSGAHEEGREDENDQ